MEATHRNFRTTLATGLISLFLLSAAHMCRAIPPISFTDTGQSLGLTSVFGLAAGDIDSDGDLDIIVGHMSGATKVYRNDGTGTFSDTGQDLGSLASRRVRLADVDNDGDLDIVQAHTAGLIVWKNDGTGTFTDSGATFPGDHTVEAFPADFDGDGDIDIVTAVYNGIANKVFLNNGTGTYTNSGVTLSALSTHSIYALDFNGDGYVDIVEGTSNGGNRIWNNNGSASFTDSGQIFGPWPTTTTSAYDINGDGSPDILFSNTGALTDKILLNNGSGTFTDSAQALDTTDTYAAAIGDYDGDGDIDFYQANNTSQADNIQLNDGAGAFGDSGLSIGTLSAYVAITADIDGDGDLDIIQGNIEAGGYVKIYRNDTNHANSAPVAPVLTAEPDISITTANTSVTLQWAAGSDANTADADFLTYDVRIGTTSGGCEVFCGTFPKSGTAIANGPGNAGSALFVKKNLAPTTYYWAVRTVDATYKRSAWSTEDSFIVDNTNPSAGSVTSAAFSQNGLYIFSPIEVSATFTVNISPVASCEYCLSTDGTCDTEWAAATWNSGTCTKTGLSCTDGQSVTLNLRATDAVGHIGTATAISRTCDATAPAAGAVTPANTDTGTVVDATFDLSTVFTEATSGVASCQYCVSTDGTCDTEWTAGTWNAGNGKCEVTGLTCTNAQALTINMRATDNAGNAGTGTAVSRVCDAAAPIAGTVTPANSDTGVFVDRTFDLGTSFNEGTGSGVASCEYCKATDGTCDTEWASGTYSSGNCTVTNLTCTNGQTLTLNMRATDNFGLAATATEITRHCSTPTPGAVVPANGDTGTSVDGTFDLSTAFLDDAGIGSCQYCKSTDGTCDTEWTDGTWNSGASKCETTGLTCTNNQNLTLNMRATNFANDVGTGLAVSRTCDTAPPDIVSFNPAQNNVINTTSPSITVVTSENGDCRWSLTDQSYAEMAGDCTGDGTAFQTCAPGVVPQGSLLLHIACRDTLGNEDTAATNEDAQFFILQGSYNTANDKQFIYICPPVPAPTVALLSQTQQLVNGLYVDVDVTQLTDCAGIAAVTAGPVALNAQIPQTVTHNITAGWNLIYNPFGLAVEFDGTHFNFKKSGDAAAVSLDVCTDVADYAVLGTGSGQASYVPDDVASIPAFSAFMVYSKAAGELIMNQ